MAALALRRRAERHDAADARVQALGDALDDAAFAGGVAALENDHDPEALQADPFLQLDQLELQMGEFIEAWQSLPAGSVRAGGVGRADQAEDLERHGLKPWIEVARKRLHHNVLVIALANKLARIAWASWPMVGHSRHGRSIRPRTNPLDSYSTPTATEAGK